MLKRNYSLLEGESCREDFGIRKKQKIDQPALPFLLEQVERLPVSIQRLIRDNYNPYVVNKTVIGKLTNNGHLIFLINKQIVIWNCSGLIDVPSIVPEVFIPFPEQMEFINHDLLVFAGNDGIDLFIAQSPNTLYYWCEKDSNYISLELPLHSSTIIGIVPNPNKREVFVITSSLSIYSVEVKETEVEYFDEKVTWTMQKRTSFSMSAILLYRHSSIIHSVLSTILPLSTPSISACNLAVDYPYCYFIESSFLRGFDLENGRLILSQALNLPPSSTVMTCKAGRSILAVLVKHDSRYSLSIYQLQQTSTYFAYSICLPDNTYNDCSIQIQETFQDIEINLVLISKTSTVYNIAFSSKKWYMYQLFLQDVLFAGMHIINPGVMFVTSSNIVSFVPEGNSKKEHIMINSYCSISDVCPPAIVISRIVNYFHKKYYKQACFLFSISMKHKLICEDSLANIYQLISSQPISTDRTDRLISFVDCFSIFKVIHMVTSKKEEIERDINQSIQHEVEELLDNTMDVVTLLPQITTYIKTLLTHVKDLSQQLPSSFSINILIWTENPNIYKAFSNLFTAMTSFPHIRYYKDIVEDCMVSIIQLFTYSLSVSSHPVVDMCIEQLETSQYDSLISLLQQQKYYSYLVQQTETLLSYSKHNKQFAEYSFRYFLTHPSTLLFSLLDQWPSFLDCLQNQPFLRIQYYIHTKKIQAIPPNDIIRLILQISDNQQRQEVLALLYFETVAEESTHISRSYIDLLITMNFAENWLLQDAKLDSSTQLDTLWVYCLDLLNQLNDSTKIIMDKMLSILSCRNQLQLNSDRLSVSLLHHALCLDECLMSQLEPNIPNSALYYVLSKIYNNQDDQVVKWEENLLSEYHISDIYYKFWRQICKIVQ